MEELETILTAVAAVFGVVGIGFTLRRINWLTEEADRSMLRLVINVLLPCFIFGVIADNDALRDPRNIIIPPAVGFASVLLGLGLAGLAARYVGRRIGLDDAVKQRTFTLAVGLQNYGYIPIPLAWAIFGEKTLGVLLVHNVGVELAIWTLGVWVISGGGAKEAWYRRLVNPPLIAIIVSLVFNFTGLGQQILADPAADGGADKFWLYRIIADIITPLGACTIPLGLLLVGATIADFLGAARVLKALPLAATACSLRLCVLPAIMLACAWLTPLPIEIKRVLVLQAAMTSAVFPIILSKHYGGDPPTAVRVAISTTLVGLMTMPLWLQLGLWLVGAEGG